MLYLDSNCLEGMDKADHFLYHQLRYFYRKRYELSNSLKPNSCHGTAHKIGTKVVSRVQPIRMLVPGPLAQVPCSSKVSLFCTLHPSCL